MDYTNFVGDKVDVSGFNVNKFTDDLWKIMKKMDSVDEKNDRREIMATDFPEFYNRYVGVSEKIIRKDNLSNLFMMLEKIVDIQNGKSSEKAEVEVGEILADQYVYPNLTKKQLKDIKKYKKMNN